jgi:hypothetical protein
MVHSVGLRSKRHAFARTLSGGQKRKLSVAIAFVGGSKVGVTRYSYWPHSRSYNEEGQLLGAIPHPPRPLSLTHSRRWCSWTSPRPAWTRIRGVSRGT